jgi:cellulose synthase operon protein C
MNLERRFSLFVLLSVIVGPTCPLAGQTRPASAPADLLKDTRSLLRTGSYDEAMRKFEELAADPQSRVQAVVGIAEAHRMLGRYADALSRLEAVNAATSDEWQLARAEVLTDVGRYREAIEAARKAVELNAKSTGARRLLGQLYETVGERQKAIETYAWFAELLRRSYPSNAAALTDAGIAIYRHAVLTRSPQATAKTKYVLRELFQPAVERVDKKYWPALLASADLLLSKYNLEQAQGDYKAALKINAKLADAHVGLGMIVLDGHNTRKAAEEVEAALKINSSSANAYVLKARVFLTDRKDAEAAEAANKALDFNPNHLDAIGVLAAARSLQRDEPGMREALTRAEKVNPLSAVVPNEVASWQALRNQFPEAESHFKKAAEMAPEWADPLTGLGMLYMETGDESAARRVLDASWKLDPFNERTFHTLNLLDKLEKFGHQESEHFIVKSADGSDAIIRPVMSAYAEEVYERICSQFNYHPEKKTIIEVFPDHAGFAVRITGRPFLHTIGATTGPVIAMDAPRQGPSRMTFNWRSVLRHEFVHTVTLAATGNRIPRWLTEGLAQREESNRRSWEACRMLVMALRRDTMYDLDSIFQPNERRNGLALAYAQSDWMVEYLLGHYGQAAINKALDGFRDGGKQSDVLAKAFGQTPEALMKEFTAWARKDAEKWGLTLEPIPSLKEIDKQLLKAKGAEKVRLLVAKAEASLDDHELDGAEKAIREAYGLDGGDKRVQTVMIQVLVGQAAHVGDKDKSETLGEECIKVAEKLAATDPNSPAACWVLGNKAIKDKEKARAVEMFQKVSSARPLDTYARGRLADLYVELKQPEKALAELIELSRLSPNEEDFPLRAARIHSDAGRHAEAVEWYRKALEVAPYDKDMRESLGQVLTRENRSADAVEEYRILTQLDPASAAAHSRLAFALYRADKKEEAKTAAKRAVSLDPKSEAKSLLAD